MTDPLGMNRLEEIVKSICDDGPATEKEIVLLGQIFGEVKQNYAALQDRYLLLKQSNKQLFEETAWLRDQFDDFALDRMELIDKAIVRKEAT